VLLGKVKRDSHNMFNALFELDAYKEEDPWS
jgi:hypothetical protein